MSVILLFYQKTSQLVHAETLPMLEIEAKYPLPDLQSLETRLLKMGVRFNEERTDADHYFNAPDRDFARTDEAFRVRRIGECNLLTWKGPKLDRETKTRKEIEVPFADGATAAEDLLRLLQELGYRPVAVVRKRRRVYDLDREGYCLHFCLDDVEKVGTFAEIEIVAEDSHFEAAKALLQRVAVELGLIDMERRSYLEMLLTKLG